MPSNNSRSLRKTLLGLATTVLCTSAWAVTDGSLDNDGHPTSA